MGYLTIICILVLLFLIPLRAIRLYNTYRRAERAGLTAVRLKPGAVSWFICGLVWFIMGIAELGMHTNPDSAMPLLHVLMGFGFEITGLSCMVFFTKKGVYRYDSRRAESCCAEIKEGEILFYSEKAPDKPFCRCYNTEEEREIFAEFLHESNGETTS